MPPKNNIAASSSQLSVGDSALIRLGQMSTGIVLRTYGKDEIARRSDIYTPALRKMSKADLYKMITPLLSVLDNHAEMKKAISEYYKSNNEPLKQRTFNEVYHMRGKQVLQKILYEFDGASTLKRFKEAKNIGGQVDQIHFLLADVNTLKGEKKEYIDPQDEDLRNRIAKWVVNVTEEPHNGEYKFSDNDLFKAILHDSHLRHTGRTKKYDIHTQDVSVKPMGGYKRNGIHSVKQTVDLNVFNKIRI